MKIKLTEYTDPEGKKYHVLHFEYSGNSDRYRTKVLHSDGTTVPGPTVRIEEMVGQPQSRCREIEAELVLSP